MAKIVLNPFGSFGDLHPYLAIAIELARRGHKPLIATSELYRSKIENEGIGFAPMRPDIGELLEQPGFLEKLWDPKNSTKYLFRDYLLPRIKSSYEDLAPVCDGADLLLTHFAAYAGPIVAEVKKLPWLSIVLQPTVFFSKVDPPVLAAAAWARHLYGLGPWVFASMMKLGELEMMSWVRPLQNLREQLGLARGKNPLISGQFSPHGTLALFSKHFSQPQPDWPANTTTTGFLSYDKAGEGFGLKSDHDDLQRFLAAGPPPVVFTLGSSAVMAAERFFEESMEAAQKLGVRAVLLAWKPERLANGKSESILIKDYVPYTAIFPHASVIVHAGGIGTVGQVLMAGRPSLIVPWAHDQPDNAERCRKLGVARVAARNAYRADKIARELDLLMNDPVYANNARSLSEKISGEDGLKTACDLIEATVSSAPSAAL